MRKVPDGPLGPSLSNALRAFPHKFQDPLISGSRGSRGLGDSQ